MHYVYIKPEYQSISNSERTPWQKAVVTLSSPNHLQPFFFVSIDCFSTAYPPMRKIFFSSKIVICVFLPRTMNACPMKILC